MAMTEEVKLERRKARKEARRLAKEQAKIEAAKNQKPVKELTITIEWKRSQTWGMNPNAEAQIVYHDGYHDRSPIFKASGCGYDKESTVIASVFNEYMKYKLWAIPEDIEADAMPYGIRVRDTEYKGYCGGVGTNCYTAIGEFIGGKFEKIASGKTFDVFKYTDGVKNG